MGFARRFGLAEASSGTLASARDGVGAGNKAPTGGYLPTALLCAVHSHVPSPWWLIRLVSRLDVGGNVVELFGQRLGLNQSALVCAARGDPLELPFPDLDHAHDIARVIAENLGGSPLTLCVRG